MKMNKFFMGLGAVAALSLAACSNDEPAVNNEDGAATGDGSTAYMTVVINAAGNSRATSGEDLDDFQQSTTENEVENANFYFYTAEGAYVTTAHIWNGGGLNDTDDPVAEKNIEFKGKTVLVLKDLNEKNAPAYIVTVLNAPEGFTYGNTLAEMEAKLALAANDADGYSYTKDAKTYFMMSTSSYVRADGANTYEYFTTKVTNDCFLQYTLGEEPTEGQLAALQPVQIYVERLAVKVNVGITETGANVVTDAAGKKYFKLTVSGGNTTNEYTGNTIGGIQVADTDLYIAIEGWGLTNLSQNSYMMKNFGYTDTDTWHNAGAAASLFRNYWAKAANIYGKTDDSNDILARYALKDYLTSYDAATFDPKTATFKLGSGAFDYCFENTNDVTMTSDNLGKLATSAMIFARIYKQNADGTYSPATTISYNGIMFSDADFKAMVLNAIQNNTATGAVKYAKKVSDTPLTYAAIDTDDIEFVAGEAANKGEVTIHLTSTAANESWYTYTGNIDGATFTESSAAAVNTALENVIKNTAISSIAAHAYMYKGGLMYYNVPIEHYRHSTPANPFVEGDYGVVRNHIYQLTVTSLAKLGNAIYDPEEVIIPDTPTEEIRYALGVKVNILSWKIVTQEVNL